MTSILAISQKNYPIYLNDILEIENLSFPYAWSYKAFLEEIKNPISHLWTIILDNALSGFICFWMFDNEIQLINIAIHPKKRDHGLAHYLMKKMIETGVSKGIQCIWLEVRVSNLGAKTIYEKFGFVEKSRRPRYYRDNNEDAIIMSLNLAKRRVAV